MDWGVDMMSSDELDALVESTKVEALEMLRLAILGATRTEAGLDSVVAGEAFPLLDTLVTEAEIAL